MFKARKPRQKHIIPDNIKRFKNEKEEMIQYVNRQEEEVKMES